MKYHIKNPARLKNLLWVDFILGSTCGLAGLIFGTRFSELFHLPKQLLHIISLITAAYSVFALYLATRTITPASPSVLLIIANWLWVVISVVIIIIYAPLATWLGKVFLLLQIIVVGALAFLEGQQVSVDTRTRVSN